MKNKKWVRSESLEKRMWWRGVSVLQVTSFSFLRSSSRRVFSLSTSFLRDSILSSVQSFFERFSPSLPSFAILCLSFRPYSLTSDTIYYTVNCCDRYTAQTYSDSTQTTLSLISLFNSFDFYFIRRNRFIRLLMIFNAFVSFLFSAQNNFIVT